MIGMTPGSDRSIIAKARLPVAVLTKFTGTPSPNERTTGVRGVTWVRTPSVAGQAGDEPRARRAGAQVGQVPIEIGVCRFLLVVESLAWACLIPNAVYEAKTADMTIVSTRLVAVTFLILLNPPWMQT